MKNLSKKLLSILGLAIFGLFLVSNTTISAKTLENENLIKLDYTIDEIRKMSLGEYYQNIFPETFNNFDVETKNELFNTPYTNKNQRWIDGALMTASSNIYKKSGRDIEYSAKTQMNFTDGSKAKQIHHSSIIYDTNGTTWLIRSDRKANANYFNMNGSKGLASGTYKMETVHTVDMPSGYWPQTSSKKSTSPWVTIH